MKPVIYFRGSLPEEDEKQAASRYFDVVERRTAIPFGRLVVPRYSALPENKELEDDVNACQSCLINSHTEHVFIADLKNWYPHIAEYTPCTWFRLDEIPEEGPFVLKGATNSKKHQWASEMYAENKREAIEVHIRLAKDSLIGKQPIYVRQYVPLRKLDDPVGFEAPPVTEEYRFFVLDGKILAGGFYWANNLDNIQDPVDPNLVPKDFLEAVIYRIKDFIRFFVVDVARTADGNWIVIELNDGQMSGLTTIDPYVLYEALHKELKG